MWPSLFLFFSLNELINHKKELTSRLWFITSSDEIRNNESHSCDWPYYHPSIHMIQSYSHLQAGEPGTNPTFWCLRCRTRQRSWPIAPCRLDSGIFHFERHRSLRSELEKPTKPNWSSDRKSASVRGTSHSHLKLTRTISSISNNSHIQLAGSVYSFQVNMASKLYILSFLCWEYRMIYNQLHDVNREGAIGHRSFFNNICTGKFR